MIGPADALLPSFALQLLSLQPHHGLAWPPVGPSYSALTASSNLARLDLFWTNPPRGIWPYVFPAMRTLPHLTSLYIFDPPCADGTSPSALGPADVSHLVSSCPNLVVFEALRLRAGPHVSELHNLTALTRVRLDYGIEPEAGSLQGLAAVTQLRDLTVKLESGGLRPACLVPLTQLRALTEIRLMCRYAVNPGVDVVFEVTTQVCKLLFRRRQLLPAPEESNVLLSGCGTAWEGCASQLRATLLVLSDSAASNWRTTLPVAHGLHSVAVAPPCRVHDSLAHGGHL